MVVPVVPDSSTTFTVPIISGSVADPRKVRFVTPLVPERNLCGAQRDLVANDTIAQMTGTSASFGAPGCGVVLTSVWTRE